MNTRRIFVILAILIAALVILWLLTFTANSKKTDSLPPAPLFSDEANADFVSRVAGNMDLNSGITMQRATPVFPEQINNVAFAVFNHTDEPILFLNQGFNLMVFRYDNDAKVWMKLQLAHVPYLESRILPPKLETWDYDINNTWDILANDTESLGYEQIRLYVTGDGEITKKPYGAYLDVKISILP